MKPRLPKEVAISYQTVKIQPLPKDAPGNVLGYYYQTDHKIEIKPGLNSYEEANTLMHELFHALYRCAGINKKSEEEQVVTVFANGVMEMMKRNPKLRTYFTKVWNGQ